RSLRKRTLLARAHLPASLVRIGARRRGRFDALGIRIRRQRRSPLGARSRLHAARGFAARGGPFPARSRGARQAGPARNRRPPRRIRARPRNAVLKFQAGARKTTRRSCATSSVVTERATTNAAPT